MKFNHLLPERLAKGVCKNSSKVHAWKPVKITAVQGGHVSISFICGLCGERASNFITSSEYRVHADNLERECEL